MHSYQSAGSGWKAALFAAVVLLFATGARPYEDTKGRFSLQVADGWSLSPQFGDMSGMVFEKPVPGRLGGGSALFIVRADPVGARTLDSYVAEIEAAFSRMPGFAKGKSASAQIAGRTGLLKTYRTKGRRLEARFVQANGFHFLLHFEAPRAAMKTLAPQAKAMVRSFSPGRTVARSPVAPEPPPTSAFAPIGRWKSSSGLVLTIDEDGTYQLADVRGTYRVDGRQLVLSRPSGKRTSFSFELDDVAGRLVLASPKLPKPMVYRRASAPKPPKRSKLIGKWRATKVEPVFELTLTEAGGFVLGPYSGKWAINGSSLRLAKSETEFITYEFRFEGARLVLSGGDLDRPVRFVRL